MPYRPLTAREWLVNGFCFLWWMPCLLAIAVGISGAIGFLFAFVG